MDFYDEELDRAVKAYRFKCVVKKCLMILFIMAVIGSIAYRSIVVGENTKVGIEETGGNLRR